MLGIPDIAAAGVSIVNKLIETHKVDEWLKLVFGFAFSWFVAFTGSMGGALIGGKPLLVSAGIGFVSGASVLTTLFALSGKTKGIMIATLKTQPVTDPDVQTFEKKK